MRTSDTGPAAPDPGPLHRGAMAGPWRVEHELGRGGMGSVYAATHDEIGKRAALKVVHAHALTPWFTAERFLLEARVVNQVSHPGIVDIFETGVLGDGRPYLVMERLDGMTLGQRLTAGRILADEVCAILLEVCEAIRAAHGANIVHRDLKLDNVFLLEGSDPAKPKIKVLDWGIAKLLLESGGANTFADRLIGTPRYVSPEQARGGSVTTKADIYSLGIMAYELFLEEPPFVAESAAELLVMHLRDLPPMPSEAWPDIPKDLEQLLCDMLAKDPDDRPTIEEVAHTLASVRSQLATRRIEWAPAVIETTRRLPVVLVTERVKRIVRWWRPLAVAAMVAGAAISARILTADAASEPAPRAAPIVHAAPPAPVTPAVAPAPQEVVMPAAEVSTTATHLDGHRRARPAPHHAEGAAPAAPLAPAPVIDTASHVVTPSAHRPRRVAAAVDPDGTIEPYR
ncbi:MAG TPA: serine/threonine-protein kinase [Kofleriaceae bacterium]|nr:serine/threonine-protein kinase [Kofleriaceae bacterium]